MVAAPSGLLDNLECRRWEDVHAVRLAKDEAVDQPGPRNIERGRQHPFCAFLRHLGVQGRVGFLRETRDESLLAGIVDRSLPELAWFAQAQSDS
jgi:hypothetical protein